MPLRPTNASFDQVFIFGDSLSDGGLLSSGRRTGIFGLTSAIDAFLPPSVPFSPLPPAPYNTRFSNGQVFTQVAPSLLGVDDANVYSFAFGGARSLGVQTLPIPASLQPLVPFLPAQAQALLSQDTNLGGQLALFEQQIQATPPSEHSAAFILIGSNDLGGFTPTNPNDPLGTALEALSLAGRIVDANLNAARTLLNDGVATIVLNTLPASSFFPVAGLGIVPPDLAALGDVATDVINAGLQLGAASLRLQGHDVRVVDLAAISDEILADASTFGFRQLTQPVLLSAGTDAVLNPLLGAPVEQTAFFDLLHPTANLHGVWAVFQAESLTSNTITRGSGNDFVVGGLGADLVLAGGGNDTVFAGLGNDTILAGLGNDFVSGGLGSDLIAGGSGDDRLFGDFGDDVLVGGAGNDELQGGLGNDALVDGLGNDRLFGGAGNDLFLFTEASILGGVAGRDLFDGGAGRDTLVLQLTSATAAAYATNPSAVLASLGLALVSIERIVVETVDLRTPTSLADIASPYSSNFGFDIDSLATGELAARLHEADLFGFI